MFANLYVVVEFFSFIHSTFCLTLGCCTFARQVHQHDCDYSIIIVARIKPVDWPDSNAMATATALQVSGIIRPENTHISRHRTGQDGIWHWPECSKVTAVVLLWAEGQGYRYVRHAVTSALLLSSLVHDTCRYCTRYLPPFCKSAFGVSMEYDRIQKLFSKLLKS